MLTSSVYCVPMRNPSDSVTIKTEIERHAWNTWVLMRGVNAHWWVGLKISIFINNKRK